MSEAERPDRRTCGPRSCLASLACQAWDHSAQSEQASGLGGATWEINILKRGSPAVFGTTLRRMSENSPIVYVDLTRSIRHQLQQDEKMPVCLNCNRTIEPDEVYSLSPPFTDFKDRTGPWRAGHAWPRPYQGKRFKLWLEWRMHTPKRVRDAEIALHRDPCLQAGMHGAIRTTSSPSSPTWPLSVMLDYWLKHPERRYLGEGRPVSKDSNTHGLTSQEINEQMHQASKYTLRADIWAEADQEQRTRRGRVGGASPSDDLDHDL